MDTIAIIDFGGQYAHLIANRIRRLGVYSAIYPSDSAPKSLVTCKGIILSGSPHSVTNSNSPLVDPGIFDLGIPILGLCYGHQLMSKMLGGTVAKGTTNEYGIATINVDASAPIFKNVAASTVVWMSHGYAVSAIPQGFSICAQSADCSVAAMIDQKRRLYGFQFHPEVTDTPQGQVMLGNFIDICSCTRSWDPTSFVKDIQKNVAQACLGKKVFLLVSGGVDSTVCFALLNKVLGPDRVVGLHIDNGLMRKDESAAIMRYMQENGFHNLVIEDASAQFIDALKGVYEPEKKRGIIGNMFLTVKVQAESKLRLNTNEWLLAQGTIYPDTIESAGTKHADRIKTHHNRVDIMLELLEKGLLIEPISQLYKDEVRMLGEALGVPKELVWRHPFPGPGLGVRLLCASGQESSVSSTVTEEVSKLLIGSGYSVTVLPVKSVGVQGDERTYAHPAVLTGPCTWEKLEEVSTMITNRFRDINRVAYLVSGSCDECVLVKAEVTTDRLTILRDVDDCVTKALIDNQEYDQVWQMPVVMLPLADALGRWVVVLRPVKSTEAMTARFLPLGEKTLNQIVASISALQSVAAILYDITHKPPGTIEWE